jgi:NAD(P)-dependent dehydrogenase (short-subunit alcohol dehydrogenase family)
MDDEAPDRPPVALVTGAAQGVGLGIARTLARTGYRVALADVQEAAARHEAAQLAAEGCEAIGLPLDVTVADAWSRGVVEVIERWGRLDLLVNNAGISPRGTPESVDEALWEQTLAINLKGPWLGIKACLPHLRATRGTIVNIGTTRATRPRRGLFVYGVSKAGLLGLTRQVAIDCIDDGVTCNMVAPGWVDTPGERRLQAQHGRPDFPAGTRNLIAPEEVGAAVAYLATPAGRRVNGTILYVDAGLHMADDVEMIYNMPDDSRAER